MVETRGNHAAHAHGVIHRDLKPANILLQEAERRQSRESQKCDGEVGSGSPLPLSSLRPKIADFSVAKYAAATGGADLTITGSCWARPITWPQTGDGTPPGGGPRRGCLCPEAILYELLTGRPPFTGTRPATILQVLHGESVS